MCFIGRTVYELVHPIAMKSVNNCANISVPPYKKRRVNVDSKRSLVSGIRTRDTWYNKYAGLAKGVPSSAQ